MRNELIPTYTGETAIHRVLSVSVRDLGVAIQVLSVIDRDLEDDRMKAIERSQEKLRLDTVLRRFEQWRRNPVGSKRIPEDLWQAAAGLARRYPISKVSRDLRLDYYELKERVNGGDKSKSAKAAAPFVELKVDEVIAVKQGCAVVEMEDGRGRKLKIALEGASGGQVLEWASRFWSERA